MSRCVIQFADRWGEGEEGEGEVVVTYCSFGGVWSSLNIKMLPMLSFSIYISRWQWVAIWSPLPLLLHLRLYFICIRLCGAAWVLHTPVNSLLDYFWGICVGGSACCHPTSPPPHKEDFLKEVCKINSGLSLLSLFCQIFVWSARPDVFSPPDIIIENSCHMGLQQSGQYLMCVIM